MATASVRSEFEALSAGHVDALYASAIRLTRNERDAEDLVQDAYLRAFRFFDRYERGTNFKAWLFKILTNTFINDYRRRGREKTAAEDQQDTFQQRFMSQDVAAASARPEESYLNDLLSDDVVKALDEVPIDFRMVVMLADLQDFSYREIAEMLDCPVGTVMSRLHRGRKLLQKTLYGYAVANGIVKEPAEREGNVVDLAEHRRRSAGG